MAKSEKIEFTVTEPAGVCANGEKVCDFVKVVGLVRTLEENVWKIRIKFKDMNEKMTIIDIENRKMTNISEVIKDLTAQGLCPSINSGLFKIYLHCEMYKYKNMKRLIEVNQTGWIDGTNNYICPSFSVSDSKEEFIFSSLDKEESGYSKKGTLDEWRTQIAEPCQNNSLLTFALCAAIAPPLLRYFPEINTTIFHLVGKSSIGKTTALKAAASVWGNPKKYIKQWRATGNAQEGIAEKYNDSLLILDEIGQASDNDIQQTVYMIGNEKGKARMMLDATLKRTKSWRLICLSSGEIGISEKIETAGKRVHGGVLVRCIDIEAQSSQDMGIFEDFRGYKNGNEFSTALAERTSKYHGTAAKAFVKEIRAIEKSTVRNIFDEALGRIKKALNLENEKDGALSRVLNCFALINTAGILASSDQFGILNHNCIAIDEDICSVLKRCLPNVYNQEEEEKEIIESFRDWLKRNDVYFIPAELLNDTYNEKVLRIKTRCEPHTQIFGYKIQNMNTYYIIPDVFKKEFCRNEGMNSIKKALAKKNMLEELKTYEHGKVKNRNPKVIVNNEKEKRYLVVHILD